MGKLKLKRKPNKVRGETPTGPKMWAEVEVERRPTDQWTAMNAPLFEQGENPEPVDDDMVVGFNVYGYMAMPSDVLPPRLWKRGRALIGTLSEIPYADFRAACEADIARKAAPTAPVDHVADLVEIGEKARAAAAAKDESPENPEVP